MIQRIDKFLNSVTMYRLALYGLGTLAAYAIILGFLGYLPYGGLAYAYSVVILFFGCWFANNYFAKLFKVDINPESAPITSLILFFMMFPAVTTGSALTLVVVSVVAMAFKYILATRKHHIFNPAALGAVILVVFGSGNVIWWVGSPMMLPAVLILGLLIVRKIRKFPMFFTYIGAVFVGILITSPATFFQNLLSYPLIFLGTIMLTEPQTMPPTKKLQIIYGAGVGLLSVIPFHFLIFYSSPEVALIAGNIFSYFVGMRQKVELKLKEKREIAKDTFEFIFGPESSHTHHWMPAFSAGQYLEWTLPQEHPDERGSRRYFTIASSPTEKDMRIGVKFLSPSSSFKQTLLDLPVGGKMTAGVLGGDFILPKDPSAKLVFIAGGIGVTPFRSIVKYLLDTKQKRDVVLFYSVKAEDEIAYREIFKEAEENVGLKVVYVVGQFLDSAYVEKEVPDYSSRIFYLSGPNAMVENYKGMLKKMGIKRSNIKTDYFPGY